MIEIDEDVSRGRAVQVVYFLAYSLHLSSETVEKRCITRKGKLDS